MCWTLAVRTLGGPTPRLFLNELHRWLGVLLPSDLETETDEMGAINPLSRELDPAGQTCALMIGNYASRIFEPQLTDRRREGEP